MNILELIKLEMERQRSQLQMIPSENYVSKNVMAAVGSVLMNKYSEGQPGKRYYRGNQVIDQIESRVEQLALKTFGLDPEVWDVNVQVLSGSVANLAVYNTFLKSGDKILSMSLPDGGHLSHGWKSDNEHKVSFSSQVYDSYFYHVNLETGMFDYNEIEKLAEEVQPKLITSGGTAYPREIDHKRMSEIAKKVGALYMADIAHEAGLVAAGVNASPFPYADVVTMTTRKTLRGPVGAMVFVHKEHIAALDKSVFPGLQGGPQNHTIAGIGVALEEAQTPEFKQYAQQIIKNAQTLAAELVNYGYQVASNGTDKHLVLIDLRKQGVSGKEVSLALEKANIITNMNTVPGETSTPWNPSGLRMGTPALTSRGMKEDDMKKIASWIDAVIKLVPSHDDAAIEKIGESVKAFACTFPVRGIDD